MNIVIIMYLQQIVKTTEGIEVTTCPGFSGIVPEIKLTSLGVILPPFFISHISFRVPDYIV
jgi:hypothetical protein